MQNSKGYGIENPIFQGLSIAKKYFGAFVPENILSALEPVKSNIGFEEIFKGLMKDNSNKKDQWREVSYLTEFGKSRWNLE